MNYWKEHQRKGGEKLFYNIIKMKNLPVRFIVHKKRYYLFRGIAFI